MHPLSIGEIADRSITLAVRRWRTLCVLVLMEALPIGLLRALRPQSGQETLVELSLDLLLVALLYPAGILTANARGVTRLRPVLADAARHYGASLLTLLASSAWIVLWVIVAAFAGVLAALPFRVSGNLTVVGVAAIVGASVAGLALLPRAGLVAAILLPIVILEHVSPAAALTLARRRVNHTGFVRSSLLGLALFAVTAAPVVVVGAVTETVVDLTHLTALLALDELITDVVSLGLGVVLSTVVSLELRARSEGSDLEAALDTAAGTS